MKIIFSLCLALLCSVPYFAQGTDPKTEEQLVRKVVESYLDKTGQSVVHSDAKIFSLDGAGNRLIESPFRSGRLRKGETIGESTQHVVSVDLANSGGVAKVETEFQPASETAVTPQKHIQYISLLKIGGEWKIVNILMPPLILSAPK